MESSELIGTLGQVLLVIALVVIIWILGAGALPLLKSLTGLTEEKRAMARKGIDSIDMHFADNPSVVGNVVHEVAEGLSFNATDPFFVSLSNSQLLTRMLETMNIILPQTPDRLTPDVIADAANDVIGVVARLTDNIPGNALPDMRVGSIKPPGVS